MSDGRLFRFMLFVDHSVTRLNTGTAASMCAFSIVLNHGISSKVQAVCKCQFRRICKSDIEERNEPSMVKVKLCLGDYLYT